MGGSHLPTGFGSAPEQVRRAPEQIEGDPAVALYRDLIPADQKTPAIGTALTEVGPALMEVGAVLMEIGTALTEIGAALTDISAALRCVKMTSTGV